MAGEAFHASIYARYLDFTTSHLPPSPPPFDARLHAQNQVDCPEGRGGERADIPGYGLHEDCEVRRFWR
jgi:hypothetical protein